MACELSAKPTVHSPAHTQPMTEYDRNQSLSSFKLLGKVPIPHYILVNGEEAPH